jgi:general secretion pathway protein D
MRMFDRFAMIVAVLSLALVFSASGDARGRKGLGSGAKWHALGQKAEDSKDWDKALEMYEKALAASPGDAAYDLSAKRARFQAGQLHVQAGQKLRDAGEPDKALAEFQKAYALDPSSQIAEQEIKRTLEMIERLKRQTQAGGTPTVEERSLTSAELARKHDTEELSRLEPPPELKALPHQAINLRMTNQPPKVLFETVGKLAGINVVFDPEYGQQGGVTKANVELNNSTLEDALDYVATMTRSFWKPLSKNAIFVTQENPQKRREYEDNVVRVFYLTNLTTPQELTEISTAIRTVADVKKVFTYNSMSALIARGTPDQIMLAQKLVNDLDKPKAEVVVDILVMEANQSKTRDLAASIASGSKAGISTAIEFTPTHKVTTGTTTPTTDTTTDTTTSQLIALSRIAKLSTNDFAVTLPGAVLQALATSQITKVLQSPQIRAANGQKATLKIGQKVPMATGGVSTSTTVSGYSSLYNSFQYLDVGVNVDLTPTVHGSDEVTLKVKLEISSVVNYTVIAGISEPVIGQRTVEHEIRLKEGEVSIVGGLMQDQDSKTVSGVPGLSAIPGLRRLFSSESKTRDKSELLIAMIPHIVRTPGISAQNMRSVASGTETVTRLTMAPLVEAAAAVRETKPVAAPAAAPAVETPATPATTAAPMRIVFRPTTMEAQAGSTFTLELDADNARDLAAAPFHLKFDPQMLRLQEVKAGALLASDGQNTIFTRNILNESGDVTVNLNRPPDTGGVSGSGSLAVFTFQAVKPGQALVTFIDLAARDSKGQPVSQDMPRATVDIK